jgi:hypothetical protein
MVRQVVLPRIMGVQVVAAVLQKTALPAHRVLEQQAKAIMVVQQAIVVVQGATRAAVAAAVLAQ